MILTFFLELIAVGQNLAALQSLHEIITSKRSKNASLQSLEPIMLRFVELCVNLRKGKMAKEGLYQFKNIAQNTNVPAIEVVLDIDGNLINTCRWSSNGLLNLQKPKSLKHKLKLNNSYSIPLTISRLPKLQRVSCSPLYLPNRTKTALIVPSLHLG